MDCVERPYFVTDEHLEYLDELRDSGETNMFGVRPYLMLEFPDLSKEEAAKSADILDEVIWRKTRGRVTDENP